MTAVVALTAVVAAAVLLAAVVGAHLLSSNGNSSAVSDANARSALSAPALAPATTGGSVLQSHSQSPSQPPPVAPSGSTTYTENGFTIDMPSDWHRRLKPGDTSGSVYWDAPDGVSYLQVDPQPWSPGDAHEQARVQDLNASKNSARFPGYQLLGIADVAFQQGAADWDFTFNDPSGAGPIHGRDRFFQAAGRPFAIYLRALETGWPGMQDTLAQAYGSFRPQ